MTLRPARLFILALTIAVAACADDPVTPTERGALCALYRAACERQAECGVYLYSRTTDVARCVTQLDCEGSAASAVAAGVAVSIANADACRAAITDATCAGLEPWRDGQAQSFVAVIPACGDVLVGTRAVGEACAWTTQCSGALQCEGDTCPGTCQVDTTTCERGTCPADQFCDFRGCTARAARGATCEISNLENTCADGLYCDIEFGSPTGTCGDPTPHGGACTVSSFHVCAGGEVCRDKTCQPPLPLDAACSSAFDCGPQGFCDFDHGNRCAPTRAVGAACGQSFYECGLRADCFDGACQPLGEDPPAPLVERPIVGAGADCADANCGPGLACRPEGTGPDPAWRCAPVAALGASCEPSDPDLRSLLLFQGARAVGACAEGLCDLFAPIWTCVAPQPPGAACSRDGLNAECTSLMCTGGQCAEFFQCP